MAPEGCGPGRLHGAGLTIWPVAYPLFRGMAQGAGGRHSGGMTTDSTLADDYDSPWKDIIHSAFPEFMAFFFAEAAARIDWTAGHEFLDTELRQVVQDAELGRRHADVLARVTELDGATGHVFVHVEVQGGREADFARRMFTYHYRLFDRFSAPVASSQRPTC